jgi:hypothetical protein
VKYVLDTNIVARLLDGDEIAEPLAIQHLVDHPRRDQVLAVPLL